MRDDSSLSTSVMQLLRKRWFPPLLLGLLVFAAYANTWHVPFVLDDEANIANNPGIRDLRSADAYWPDRFTGLGGRPALSVSFALNYAAHGLALPGFHLTNLAMHWGTALLLFTVVRRTLRKIRPEAADGTNLDAHDLALVVAALWAVHPVNTAAVTYITQRAEVQLGLCALGALYCFVRGTEGVRAPGWFAGATLFVLTGVWTKEVGVVVPFLLLVHDRTFAAGSFREAWRRRWKTHLCLWLAAACVIPSVLQMQTRGVGEGAGYNWLSYGLVECKVVPAYLWLAVFPASLTFDYGNAFAIPPLEQAAWCATLVALVATAFWLFATRPRAGYLAAWFLIVLAPSSSVIPLRQMPMAEYRLYLALMAVVVAVVLALERGLGRRARVVFVLLVAAAGVNSFLRNDVFRSALTLWEDTVQKCPTSARAWVNLGTSYLAAGRIPEAGDALLRGRSLDPQSADAHYNLGFWFMEVRRAADAAPCFAEAVRLNPRRSSHWLGLGNALFTLGQQPAAGAAYRRAVELAPLDPDAHNNLGCWQATQREFGLARASFMAALRLDPAHAGALASLAKLNAETSAPPAPPSGAR